MPSRKKKQGRARKAKQAESRSINPYHNFNCDHLVPDRNWLQRDFEAANNLQIKFELAYKSLFNDDHLRDDVIFVGSTPAMIHGVYDEYFQFSKGGKEYSNK